MRSLVLFFLACSTLGALAQWTTPDVNTLLSSLPGPQYNPTETRTAPGPDGSTYVAWQERNRNYRLMMQRLSAEGLPMWGEGGFELNAQSSAIQMAYACELTTDLQGNAVIAFSDHRHGTQNVVVYRMTPDGTQLWGPDGVSFPGVKTGGDDPHLAVLSDGRIAVAWTMRSSHTVAYTLLPAEGMPTVAPPLVISDALPILASRIVAVADGGFWITYKRVIPLLNWQKQSYHARRLDANGAEVLAVDITDQTLDRYEEPLALHDGHNGLYVAFTHQTDVLNETMSEVFDVRVQRVRANGSLWSASGSRVDLVPEATRHTRNQNLVVLSDEAGIGVAYARSHMNLVASGVFLQRFDTAGNALLGNAALELVPETEESAWPEHTQVLANGDLLMVYATGYLSMNTMYGIVLDAQGQVVPGQEQLPICTTPTAISYASVAVFESHAPVAVWTDSRHYTSVMAQSFGMGISTGMVTERSAGIRLLHGHGLELLTEQALPLNSHLTIHTADGRLVASQHLGAVASATRIPLSLPHDCHGLLLVSVFRDGVPTVLRGVVAR